MNLIDNKLITTLDDRGNLLAGEIIIKDKDKLIEFRKHLLKETYEGKNPNFEIIMPKTPRVSFDNDARAGLSSKNGLLIRDTDFVADYLEENGSWVYDYNREIIGCNHLNTILLLTSMLDYGERYYNSVIALEFMKAGIFDASTFSETWRNCRKGILDKNNFQDLEAFRNAFMYGGIAYQVENSWLKREIATMNVLKTLGIDLTDLAMNTRILNNPKVLKRYK